MKMTVIRSILIFIVIVAAMLTLHLVVNYVAPELFRMIHGG